MTDYEQVRDEVSTAVHGLMACMDTTHALPCDPDEWLKYVQRVVWWHPDVRHIHPGEADKDRLEQEAIDAY